MRRLLDSVDTLEILVITMIAMIFSALIVPHFSNSTKGMKTTHAYRATANLPVRR